jgi:hypothetical protein
MKKGVGLAVALGALALCSAGFALWAFLSIPGGADVKLYDAPSTIQPSKAAKLKVDGSDAFVYDAFVNPARQNKGDYDVSTVTRAPMAYFDFAGGAVDIDIELTDTAAFPQLKSATVSPLSKGIKARINGRHVQFRIDDPGQYVVQFNGGANEAFHLFANPIETEIPDKTMPNVIWIGPGEWNIPDGIQLKSGQTLYISGGAVVHTTITAQYAQNVKILGRGIIDGSNWPGWKGQDAHVPIDFRGCDEVSVEGIIVNNPNAWTFNSFETKNAVIDNVKLISARPNGDGFTLQSCTNYTVKNSFARTWDDTLVVKNYGGNSSGITFENMVLWTDLAQSMEIGYETNKGKQENSHISDVKFENITVVNAFHKPVMSIHNADDALVQNITYKNIMVENADMGNGDARDNDQLIDITIAPSSWSSTKTRGNVKNVSFENITVLRGIPSPKIRLIGYDDGHAIDGVSIRGLTVYGKKILSPDDIPITSRFCNNVFVGW